MASFGARPSLDHFRQPEVFIKVPEIVLLVIAIVTYFPPWNGKPIYVASVLVPCLLNALVFMTNYILGYSQLKHTPVELALYTYYVFGLFISAIALLVTEVPSLIASGVFCLILTLLYCVEVYLSYLNMINRVPLPADNPGANPGVDPHFAVPPGNPPAYSSSPPSIQPQSGLGVGTVPVDLDRVGPWPNPASVYSSNPVYPQTMNYPPYPSAGTPTTTPDATQNETKP